MAITNISSNISVLVMLSDDCCLPCHTFESHCKNKTKLSLQNVRDILLWAADAEPKMPEILFLVGRSDPIDPSVATILEDIADLVVTPLLSIEQQESLGIPFSTNQTVIVNCLNQIVDQADSIADRPIILHIEREEIDKLAESLLVIQDFIGNITLRPHNIHLWEDNDFLNYERQLASISNVGFMKSASSTEGKLNLLNLNVASSVRKRINRCPAGAEFVAIGPDGYIYPCPAFYNEGQRHSIGSIKDKSTELRKNSLDSRQCSFCNSLQCPGCPFLELGELPGKEKICKIYEIENKIKEGLLNRVTQSGYLFDCLRTLKTKECATKSQNEGGESLDANQQVHDVTFDEFIQSLKDIKIVAEQSLNNGHDTILNYWCELKEIPLSSQRNIFRRRVYEILEEIIQNNKNPRVPIIGSNITPSSKSS